MARKLRQVIVGNGGAALSAIKAIRKEGQSCDILLISAENCNAYSPVMITYYLSRRISKGQLFIADSNFYKQNDVVTIFGDKAVGLEPSKQTLHLESGRQVAYDNLLIATGASPKSLEGEHLEATNIISLRTMLDVEKISELTETAREVIIIGGGLVGLQIADALYKEGIKLTIIEGFERILFRNFDGACAETIQRKMESRGVSILCGTGVRRAKKEGEKVVVISDSGQEFKGDMVIVCMGVDPNIGWLRNSSVRVNRGILVDEFMRTSFENIFAAGDVTEGNEVVTGQTEVLPGWGMACIQGRIAGLNMAGCQVRYAGRLIENTATLFGLTAASIGLISATAGKGLEELQFSDSQRGIYRKILLAENRIMGTILLGMTEDAGVFKNLIMNKVDVSPWKEQIARAPLNLRSLVINQWPKFWSLY